MNRSYDDLMAMSDRLPSFFQKDGVPRWAAFDPQDSTGVYAREAAVLEIACQSCDARFHVLVERDGNGRQASLRAGIEGGSHFRHDLKRELEVPAESLAYGDPPNVDCCRSGPTMTSETVRVVEFWTHEGLEWTRDPSLERPFRRFDDPWTPEMLERARRAIEAGDDTPEMLETLRSVVADQEALAAARDGGAQEEKDEPRRFTAYVSATDAPVDGSVRED